MKKISIITINYNDAIGLEKTISSVLSQSFDDFEYIVIDGGSSDASKSVIEKYQSKITYWVSEKDNGRYHAMNKGIIKAQGEYCLFLNSGDYLVDKDVFKNMFSGIVNSDILYGDMLIDWGQGNVTLGKSPDRITFERMYSDTLWHPVSFIRRSLFEKYGLYNEVYKIVADYDFFFKVIIMKVISLQHKNVSVAVYNVNGLSSLPENKLQERAERKAVLNSYLTPAIIEFAERNCNDLEPERTFLQKLKHFLR